MDPVQVWRLRFDDPTNIIMHLIRVKHRQLVMVTMVTKRLIGHPN